MFSFFWFWFIFINIILLLIILLLHYVFNDFYEILYKISYYLISYICTLCILFYFSEDLFFLYLNYIGKIISIRDPQEYVYFFLEVSILISFLILLPVLFLYFNFFIVEIITVQEYFYYFLFVLYYSYFFIIMQWVFIEDFLFFHWEIFLSQERLIFDFQPDLFFLYSFYKNEYFDLGLLFFIIVNSLLVFYSGYIQKIVLQNKYFSLFYSFIFISFSLYFFGGESFLRDFLIFLSSFFFVEMFIISNLFFGQIKKNK